MKAVIQRVSEASVSIGGVTMTDCGAGLLILLGISNSDSAKDADILAEKISKLRIFSDKGGKMNLSVIDTEGEVLVISNFTLYADCRRGNRPDFLGASNPDKAEDLYEYFVLQLGELVSDVKTGIFGADMKVSLINDGPVTIVMESEVLLAPKKR